MAVGTGDAKDQRDALAVRDDVAFAARFSPVCGVGPRVWPPGGWARWPIHAGAAEMIQAITWKSENSKLVCVVDPMSAIWIAAVLPLPSAS